MLILLSRHKMQNWIVLSITNFLHFLKEVLKLFPKFNFCNLFNWLVSSSSSSRSINFSSWLLSLSSFRLELKENKKIVKKSSYFFNLWVFLKCITKLLIFAHLKSQRVQLNKFWFKWVFIWVLSVPFSKNSLKHILHLNGLIPSWDKWWTYNLYWLLNSLSHPSKHL